MSFRIPWAIRSRNRWPTLPSGAFGGNSAGRLPWTASTSVPRPSVDEGALLDVDHPRVEHLFVDLEVVDQAQAADEAVADELAGHLAELDLDDHVVGLDVVRDARRVAPHAGAAELRGGGNEVEG